MDWRLRAPAARVPLIERDSLLDRMTRDAGMAVTLVMAPAGFGKSILLAAWQRRIEAAGGASAWLTLETADGEADALAAALAAALDRAGLAGADIDTLAVAPASSAFAQQLSAAMARRGLNRLTLFLDQFERIARAQAAGWLADVAMRTTGSVHWAIASRVEPLPAFSPLRIQGFVQVFIDEDLRFSDREAVKLIARRPNVTERAAIAERLEGWPVAVQALHQQLSLGITVDRALAQLTRRCGMLSDYIEAELLAPLADALIAFLRDASILSEIDAGTADLVRNRSDSRCMIAALDTLGSLMRELEPGRWRLHPALREYLEALFDRQPETDVTSRRMAAAYMLIARQDYVGAVRNALLAGNPREAMALISAIGPVRLWWRFGLHYVMKVMRMLPADLVAEYPAIRIGDVLFLICQGRITPAANLLEDIRADTLRLGDPDRLQEIEAEIAGVEVLIIVNDVISQAALERLGAYSVPNGGPLSDELGIEAATLGVIAHQQWGELDEAERLIPFAQQMLRRWGSNFNDYFPRLYQGWIVQARGRPGEAIEHYRGALEVADDLNDMGLESLGQAMIAEALYAAGDFKRATEQVDAWMVPLERSMAWYDFLAAMYVTAALLRLRGEGMNAALAVVERMRLLAMDRRATSLPRLIAPLKLLLLTRAGAWRAARLYVAEQALDERCATIPEDPRQSAWRERDLLRTGMAEFHIGTGNLTAARACIERMAEDATRGGRAAALLTTRLMRAALLWRQGARGQAVALLGESIEEVVATGQLGLLMARADMLEPALQALRRAGIMRTAIARRLLQALAADAERRKADRSSRLTPREHEVLTLVGAGDSNKSIARRLDISENTVKFHLKRIAVKVDAVGSGRVSLVHAARQHGIFS